MIFKKVPKPNKFGAKPVVFDKIKFDSTKEGYYYLKFKTMEQEGKIQNLRRQVKFELVPKVVLDEWDEVIHLKTKDKIKHHIKVQQPICYVADFVYTDVETGRELVVDVKSEITRKDKVYCIKKKMMRAFKGIEITEF